METGSCRRVYAEVDLDAIAWNLSVMERKLPSDTKIMAVIKTNGYGHGAVPIAHQLEEDTRICGYAVATAEEAVELRKAGVRKMILVLGYVFFRDYEELIRQEVRFSIYRYDMAEALNRVAESCNKKALVHIKIDTGMHRIGYPVAEESVQEIKKIADMPWLELEGIFTHFARADEKEKRFAKKASDDFMGLVDDLKAEGVVFPICHCCNSAAILEMPECHQDMVRAGITLYGLWPSDEMDHGVELRPAMSLFSHIVHIKTLDAGSEISYGGTYVTKRKSRIATIPVGYGDGYPRSLSNQGYVLIHGKQAPVVGRICMDQFMVDVTDIPEAEYLDRVTLIGKDGDCQITMEQLGDISGRFNYELSCDLGMRIPRFYKKQGEYIDEMKFHA